MSKTTSYRYRPFLVAWQLVLIEVWKGMWLVRNVLPVDPMLQLEFLEMPVSCWA